MLDARVRCACIHVMKDRPRRCWDARVYGVATHSQMLCGHSQSWRLFDKLLSDTSLACVRRATNARTHLVQMAIIGGFVYYVFSFCMKTSRFDICTKQYYHSKSREKWTAVRLCFTFHKTGIFVNLFIYVQVDGCMQDSTSIGHIWEVIERMEDKENRMYYEYSYLQYAVTSAL